jgi:hypothetical protein
VLEQLVGAEASAAASASGVPLTAAAG